MDNPRRLYYLVSACLVVLSSGCSNSIADRSVGSAPSTGATNDPSSSAVSKYGSLLPEARHNALIDKRRVKSVAALARRIQNTASYELVEWAWLKATEEALRLYGTESDEYRNILHDFGEFYANKSRFAKAEQLYREDLKLYLPTANVEDSSEFQNLTPAKARIISQDMFWLANILQRRGQRDAAANLKKTALVLYHRGGDTKDLVAQVRVANALAESDLCVEGKREYLRILQMTDEKIWHYQVYLQLARLEGRCKNFLAAVSYYKEAIKVFNLAESSDYPTVYLELARTYRHAGDLDSAADCFKKSQTYFEIRKVPTNVIYSAATNELAGIYLKQERYTEAKAAINKCVADAFHHPHGSLPRSFAITALGLRAELNERQNQKQQAAEDYRTMIALAETAKNNIVLFNVLQNAGRFFEPDNWPYARQLYKRALAALESERPGNHKSNWTAYQLIGLSEFSHADFARAEELFEKTLKSLEANNSNSGRPEAVKRRLNISVDTLVRLGAATTYQRKYQVGQEYFARAENLSKNADVTKEARAHVYETWSLCDWISGNGQERAHFDQGRSEWKRTQKEYDEKLQKSIEYLNEKYGKSDGDRSASRLEQASRALTAMRDELGSDSLYALAMVREIANLFELAGNEKDAAIMRDRAEREKEVVLGKGPSSP